MSDDVTVDTTVQVSPTKRKDGHISAGLSADQTLFERVQSTKLLLAFFIFSVSAVFCWFGKIDAKAYSDIAAWVIMAYVAGDVGTSAVDAFKSKFSNNFNHDHDSDGK
jgi:amino acid permease